jgi:hypothetical protein
MPLQPESETGTIRHPEGFDDAVGSPCLDAQIATQFPDSLPMQRVHLQAIRPCDFAQHSSRLQQHFMGRTVLRLERQSFVVTVIKVTWYLVQPLVQRAAVGNIHFLKTAANRQYRQSGGNRPRNQRKRRSIPIWIM